VPRETLPPPSSLFHPSPSHFGTMSPPLAVCRNERLPCCADPSPSSAKGDPTSDSREALGRHSLCLECTICLETPASPVVTFCGHLFCYGCLAEWLKVHSTRRQCPVCKAGVSQVVRILGQGMPMDVLHFQSP